MQHMRAISELIKLNVNDMEKNYISAEYKIYGDEDLTFE